VRHSIGARLSRPVAETNPGWDFDYEALWQFGRFGSANIRAWTVASETGYGRPAELGYFNNYLIDNQSCVIVGVQATAAQLPAT
jgi:hypothetical protein